MEKSGDLLSNGAKNWDSMPINLGGATNDSKHTTPDNEFRKGGACWKYGKADRLWINSQQLNFY